MYRKVKMGVSTLCEFPNTNEFFKQRITQIFSISINKNQQIFALPFLKAKIDNIGNYLTKIIKWRWNSQVY